MRAKWDEFETFANDIIRKNNNAAKRKAMKIDEADKKRILLALALDNLKNNLLMAIRDEIASDRKKDLGQSK